MAKVRKCIDSHALMEIMQGNEKYARYLNSDFLITDITLAEVYSALLKDHDEHIVQQWHDKLEKYSVNVDKKTIINAMKFRHLLGKKNISFADAVAYSYSILNGCEFVTAENEFEGFDNVEIVKK